VQDFQLPTDEYYNRGSFGNNGTKQIANLKIPGLPTRAMLDLLSPDETSLSVKLSFAGEKERSLLITRETNLDRDEMITSFPAARLQVNGQHAFVLHRDRLYRFNVPSLQKQEDGDLIPLSLAYEQTEILLSKGPKTELKHRVIGGKAPVTFSLSAEHEALS